VGRHKPRTRSQEPHEKPCRDWGSSISETPCRNWFGNTSSGQAFSQRKYGKHRNSWTKENLTQNRRDDRRDVRRKNEILKNGIKGITKITGKYDTRKPLTEVKIRCPCGLKLIWQEDVASPEVQTARDRRTITWIKEYGNTAKLQSHSSRLTHEAVEIRLEALVEMTLLYMQTNPTHRTSERVPSSMILDPERRRNCLWE